MWHSDFTFWFVMTKSGGPGDGPGQGPLDGLGIIGASRGNSAALCPPYLSSIFSRSCSLSAADANKQDSSAFLSLCRTIQTTMIHRFGLVGCQFAPLTTASSSLNCILAIENTSPTSRLLDKSDNKHQRLSYAANQLSSEQVHLCTISVKSLFFLRKNETGMMDVVGKKR